MRNPAVSVLSSKASLTTITWKLQAQLPDGQSVIRIYHCYSGIRQRMHFLRRGLRRGSTTARLLGL
jgi:hypothetical protein